jgi:hypothetical protein
LKLKGTVVPVMNPINKEWTAEIELDCKSLAEQLDFNERCNLTIELHKLIMDDPIKENLTDVRECEQLEVPNCNLKIEPECVYCGQTKEKCDDSMMCEGSSQPKKIEEGLFCFCKGGEFMPDFDRIKCRFCGKYLWKPEVRVLNEEKG